MVRGAAEAVGWNLILNPSVLIAALRLPDVAPAAPVDTTSGMERRERTLLSPAEVSRVPIPDAAVGNVTDRSRDHRRSRCRKWAAMLADGGMR